jgi:hypothetical protein
VHPVPQIVAKFSRYAFGVMALRRFTVDTVVALVMNSLGPVVLIVLSAFASTRPFSWIGGHLVETKFSVFVSFSSAVR